MTLQEERQGPRTGVRRADLLAAAVEHIDEGVVITDAGGGIVYANPAFERISGYSREEVLGQNPRFLKSGRHDRGFYRRMWETISAGETWTGHCVNRRKDGRLYEEESTISPIRGEDGAVEFFVAIKRDVTQIVELEEQLRESQRLETVGRLAGGIAHDFNNLLTAIAGYAGQVDAALEDGHSARQDLAEILRASERAERLTRQLLAFGRKQMLEAVELDLNQVVARVAAMLQPVIGDNVVLMTRCRANQARIKADPGQLEQVLVDLSVNARDAMPSGGELTLATDVVSVEGDLAQRLLCARPGPYVRLSVADTGQGMSPEVLARVFEPFFTTKPRNAASGLGLSTVYGIVKQSGGYLWVESEPGHGSTFYVYFPQAEPPREAAPAPKPGAPTPSVRNVVVLVAEDEELLRTLAQRILSRAGYTVLTAPTGEQALELAQGHQGPIHVLLTDLVMPGMNGVELAERLAAVRPGVLPVFTSGYADQDVVDQALLKPGSLFLPKPYSADALVTRLNEAVAQVSRAAR